MKMELFACPLFYDLTKNEIDEILSRSVNEVVTFEKGQHVVRQGDIIHSLYILVEGLVRTEMVTKDGNVVEIEFIEPVRPLAPAFLVATENRYPVDVISMQKEMIRRIYQIDKKYKLYKIK
jgi:CRP-like cAMP-binding protein